MLSVKKLRFLAFGLAAFSWSVRAFCQSAWTTHGPAEPIPATSSR